MIGHHVAHLLIELGKWLVKCSNMNIASAFLLAMLAHQSLRMGQFRLLP